MKKRRHERPLKRTNPSGRVVWVARYTAAGGERRSAGTFEVRGPCRLDEPTGECCAQHAIDHAYERAEPPRGARTVGEYAATWTTRHPRAERTNKTNDSRVRALLDVEVDGRALRHWPYNELRARHVVDLVDVLLRGQGRAAEGAQNILRVFSAMTTDAITDDVAEVNVFRDVRVRVNDPRITKMPKRVGVCSWEQMHAFAAAAGAVRTSRRYPAPMDPWRPVYAEAMVRVFTDAGLRIGEVLPLERSDLRPAGPCTETIATKDRGVVACPVTVPHLHVRRTAHEGSTLEGTKTTHGTPEGGRAVPLAVDLERLLRRLPARIDTPRLFPTPKGDLWGERAFYRHVWDPARVATGMVVTPHVFRHSWISLLQAAGVDHADLAEMAGHTVETMHGRYSHALGRSFETAAQAIGA